MCLFGPKSDGMARGWRKLHNEELHKLYSSPNKIRMTNLKRTIFARHVARMGARRNA
jgi:hypothetical protein